MKEILNEIIKKFLVPNDEDYFGVMNAIHRLSETYLLEPKHLRLGNISHIKSHHSSIRPLDCKSK